MQKIINEPQAVVDEMVEGYVKAHSGSRRRDRTTPAC